MANKLIRHVFSMQSVYTLICTYVNRRFRCSIHFSCTSWSSSSTTKSLKNFSRNLCESKFKWQGNCIRKCLIWNRSTNLPPTTSKWMSERMEKLSFLLWAYMVGMCLFRYLSECRSNNNNFICVSAAMSLSLVPYRHNNWWPTIWPRSYWPAINHPSPSS